MISIEITQVRPRLRAADTLVPLAVLLMLTGCVEVRELDDDAAESDSDVEMLAGAAEAGPDAVFESCVVEVSDCVFDRACWIDDPAGRGESYRVERTCCEGTACTTQVSEVCGPCPS